MIGGDRFFNLLLIGGHFLMQKQQEVEFFFVLQPTPGLHHITGERHARRLPSLGQQIAAISLDIVAGFLAAAQVQQLTPRIGNGIKKL